MKASLCWTLAALAALGAVSLAQSAQKKPAGAISGRDRLVGAWHLVSLDEPGTEGKLNHLTDRKGMLIYTRDGRMSVQLMLPQSESAISNDYVQNGYEASFGSYDVNEAAQTVTHHVEGSVTRGLVGKDLARAYRFADNGQLIIQSTRSDEHWRVTWEHY
jgi:Lipocalin-like domain